MPASHPLPFPHTGLPRPQPIPRSETFLWDPSVPCAQESRRGPPQKGPWPSASPVP